MDKKLGEYEFRSFVKINRRSGHKRCAGGEKKKEFSLGASVREIRGGKVKVTDGRQKGQKRNLLHL